MKVALDLLLPRMMPRHVSAEVHDLGSKSEFLKKVHNRLLGYAAWLPHTHRVVLVVDADQDDCVELRARLLDATKRAGLSVASVSGGVDGQVLPRIAVEMLEAWFYGDPAALTQAYGPGFGTVGSRRGFRNPDQIRDPARRIEMDLKRNPRHSAGLRKLTLAGDVAPHMDVDRNSSTSFCRLRDGVRFLTNSAQEHHATSH